MHSTEVVLYTDQGNSAVLQLPNRHYPGVVIQGDSLLNLVGVSESLLLKIKNKYKKNIELIDEAEEIYFELNNILEELKRVAKNENLDVPYLK